MNSEVTREPNTHIRRLLVLALAVFGIGSLPIFARIVGIQFLPSKEWVAQTLPTQLGVGIAAATIFAVALFRNRLRANPDSRSLSQLFVLLLGPFMVLAIAVHSVSVGFPMIYTSLAGHDSKQRYTVKKATGYSDRKCRNEIKLREMPFMFDVLCGFPEEFRSTLRPGADVVVSGRGSSIGVFVDRARAVEQ